MVNTKLKPTGVANIGRNKGGVMISFKIFKHSFCFLNCHLAAGASLLNMDYRRRDAFEILKALRPDYGLPDLLHSSDFFFWMGDFNFRVDCKKKLNQGSLKKYIKPCATRNTI